MTKFNRKNDTIRIICIGIVSYIAGLLALYMLGENEYGIYVAGFVSVTMFIVINGLTESRK